MCKNVAKPFLKWAGGKGQLLNQFSEMYPQELADGKIETYMEPFAGGGAVLFRVLQNYNIKKAYINDINKELINYLIREIKLYNDKVEIQFNSPIKSPDNNQGFFILSKTKELCEYKRKQTLPQITDMHISFYI